MMFRAMRIASLLASGTEIVYALGLEDHLVAISHECDYPPEAVSKPRVSRLRFDPTGLTSGEIDAAVRRTAETLGTVYELDESMLRQLAPDLLLAQDVCAVCAVPTSLAEQAVRALQRSPHTVSLNAHSIDGVLTSIVQVGEAAGALQPAQQYVAALRTRIAAVRDRVRGAGPVRVLAIEWLDPPYVPGHWVPEMIETAGGSCVVGTAALPSQRVTWQELCGYDPDVLIVMPCGYGLERAREEADRHAARLFEVGRRAVDAGRAFVVDGSSYFNRSGPRMVDGIEIAAALLYPERFRQAGLAGKAERWR